MKIILAGPGAFGKKHLDSLKHIEGVEVVALVGQPLEPTQAVAAQYGILHAMTDLDQALALPGVEAAILATPTPIHATQAIQCLKAGVHVEVEIPLADNWLDAQAVVDLQQETGLVCMDQYIFCEKKRFYDLASLTGHGQFGCFKVSSNTNLFY